MKIGVRELAERQKQKVPEQPIIGLAANPPGVPFCCKTCEYIDAGRCNNPVAKLFRRPVDPEWCCDYYDHPGMRRIIP